MEVSTFRDTEKGIITAEQKSLLANQASITAQYEKNADLEKEIALRKDADKLTAYKNTLSSGLQNDAIGLQNSLNSNTVLSQEQKRQQELTKIASDYQKKQVELTNQRNQPGRYLKVFMTKRQRHCNRH